MNQRIPKETLIALRKEIGIRSAIHALQIPWRQDDMKLRFVCPQCRKCDTSIHPEINLARCFFVREISIILILSW